MDKTNAQSIDLEKSMEAAVISAEDKPLEKCSTSSESFIHSSVAVSSRLARWNTWIEGLDGFEARGIARVPPEERYESSILGYAKMVVLWFSMNVTAMALALGFLGPLVLNLGFVDTVMTAVFGSLVGTVAVAYMSIWGAQSGHRTMVCLSFRSLNFPHFAFFRGLEGPEYGLMISSATQIVARYFMGYWPAKLTCFLNILIMVGYSVIASIIAGQILSAVSGGSMSVVVGIIITSLISWLIALFGMPVFQTYERYVGYLRHLLTTLLTLMASRWAWIPQFVVLLILVGVARRNFDTSLKSSGGSTAVTAGRLTYFSLTLSGPVSWAAAASDYYVYVSPPVVPSPYIVICDLFLMKENLMTLSAALTNRYDVVVPGDHLETPSFSNDCDRLVGLMHLRLHYWSRTGFRCRCNPFLVCCL